MKTERRTTALLLALAMLASACSALTPATDGRASDTTTESGNGDNNDGDNGDPAPPAETTTTVEFDDPEWQELEIELVPIAQLEEPVAFSARSGTLHYYVAERAGRVRVIERTVSPKGKERLNLSSTPILDISEMVSVSGERGLLGITFSTDGRQLYVHYSDLDGASVIAEYRFGRNGRIDTDTRRELLRVPQPFENHNGGDIKLGEDGFLYIGLGDGGGSGDPQQSAQDLSSLLGKILRIDTFSEGDQPYSIPDGNPYVDGGGEPEIWLSGVRNPWRFSFDRETGDLWIADVGQDRFEEVNLLTVASGGGRAANLGWNRVEATTPFDGGSVPDNHTSPLYYYEQQDGRCSVTGGYVYRGEIMPLLAGVYFFGDYCSGEIWGLEARAEGLLIRPAPFSVAKDQLVSFGEGADGELFILTASDGEEGLGTVYRIEPTEVETEGS